MVGIKLHPPSSTSENKPPTVMQKICTIKTAKTQSNLKDELILLQANL